MKTIYTIIIAITSFILGGIIIPRILTNMQRSDP
jgi:hypothetical protein